MMEPAQKTRHIYSSVYDDETLKLVIITEQVDYNGNSSIKRTSPTIIDVYNHLRVIQKTDKEAYIFYLSWLILDDSEPKQRKLLERIIKHNTRNIKLVTEKTRVYLEESWIKAALKIKSPSSRIAKMTQKEKKKLAGITSRQLNTMLNDAFSSVREQLQFPKKNIMEFNYTITDEVISLAKNKECIDYLTQLSAKKYIFIDDFKEIRAKLKDKYTSDAKTVIESIKDTENRDHLAVFSISTEYTQIYVSLANESGNHIKMESWKFLRLMETPERAIRLHEFTNERWNTPTDDLFVFNFNKKGTVVGKFSPKESFLDIACLEPESEKMSDRSTFILDSTYILTVYSMLSRLEQDKERFKLLLDKAKTGKIIVDPFSFFPNEIQRKNKEKQEI